MTSYRTSGRGQHRQSRPTGSAKSVEVHRHKRPSSTAKSVEALRCNGSTGRVSFYECDTGVSYQGSPTGGGSAARSGDRLTDGGKGGRA
jgi:hypothetical protein